MLTRDCDFLGCDHPVEVNDGLAMAYCMRHQEMITDDKNFAVICWHCGTVVLCDTRPKALTERYVFRDGCPRCMEKSIAEKGEWMTLTGNSLIQVGEDFEQIYKTFPSRIEAEKTEYLGKDIFMGPPTDFTFGKSIV